MGASNSKWYMCNFSPSWDGILIKIKIFINAQQWKDVQGGHQQVRDFNRFLEDRVKKKKKKDQVVAGKPGKSKSSENTWRVNQLWRDQCTNGAPTDLNTTWW